jgi:hypothetical protein
MPTVNLDGEQRTWPRLRPRFTRFAYWAIPLGSCLLMAFVLLGAHSEFYSHETTAVGRLPWIAVTNPTSDGEQWKPVSVPPGNEVVVSRAVRLRSEGAKLIWMIAFSAQFLTFIAALYFFEVRLWYGLRRAGVTLGRRVCRTLLLIAVAVGAGIAFGLVGQYDDWHARTTEGSLTATGFDVPSRMLLIAAGRLATLRQWINIQNGLAMAMILMGLFAIGTCNLSNAADESRRNDLVERREELRLLLTVCAVVLSIGVSQIFLEFRWVSVHFWNELKEGEFEKPWEPAGATCSATTLTAAVFLSLLLICAFGSSGLLLQRDIGAYNRGPRFGDVELTFSLGELISDAIKTVSPLLTLIPLTAFLK